MTKRCSQIETKIYKDLPKPILNKLITEIYADDIGKLKLLSGYEIPFIVDIIINCRPFQALRGEIIWGFGDVCEDLIFITKGTIRMTTSKGKFEIVAGFSNDGGFIGDLEYYKKGTCLATYYPMSNCDMLALDHKKLTRILNENFESGLQFQKDMKKRYDNFLTVLRASTENKSKSLEKNDFWSKRRLTMDANDNVVIKATLESVRKDDTIAAPRKLTSSWTFNSPNPNSKAKKKRRNGSLVSGRSKVWMDGVIREESAEKITSMVLLAVNEVEDALSFRVLRLGNDDCEELQDMELSAVRKSLILHPHDPLKICWDFFVGVFILLSFFLVPIQLAFVYRINEFNYLIDAVFMTDMLLSFRTAYRDTEEEAHVIIARKIVKHYLSTWFIIDFLSSVPFDAIFVVGLGYQENGFLVSSLLKAIRLLRLLRLTRLFRSSKTLSSLEDYLGITPVVFDLVKLLVNVFCVTHTVGCFWWGLSQQFARRPWFDEDDLKLRNEAVKSQYLTSVYWTLTTMTTTGYGDITASNSAEQIMNIVIMLIGASVFGYIISDVSTLLDSLNRTEYLTMEKLAEINDYLTDKRCTKQLFETVMGHFRHLYSDACVFDTKEIMSCLPPSISRKILLIQHRRSMGLISILKYIDNDSVRLYLFQLMTPTFFNTNQYIVKDGEEAQELMFVVKGFAYNFKRNNKKGMITSERPRGRTNSITVAYQPIRMVPKKKRNKMKRRNSLFTTSSKHMTEFSSILRVRSGSTSSNNSGRTDTKERPCSILPPIQEASSFYDENLSPDNTSRNLDRCRSSFEPRTNSSSDVKQNSYDDYFVGYEVQNAAPFNVVQLELAQRYDQRSGNDKQSETVVQSVHLLDDMSTPSATSRLGPPLTEQSGESKGETEDANQFSRKPFADTQSNDSVDLLNGRGPTVRNAGDAAVADDVIRASSLNLCLPLREERTSEGGLRPSSPLPHGKSNRTSSFAVRMKSSDNGDESEIGEEEEEENGYEIEYGATDLKPFAQWTEIDMKKRGVKLLGKVVAGDIIGYQPLMQNRSHKSSIGAVTPCTVYALTKSDIAKIIRTEPKVAISLQFSLSYAINLQQKYRGKDHLQRSRRRFVTELKDKFLAAHPKPSKERRNTPLLSNLYMAPKFLKKEKTSDKANLRMRTVTLAEQQEWDSKSPRDVNSEKNRITVSEVVHGAQNFLGRKSMRSREVDGSSRSFGQSPSIDSLATCAKSRESPQTNNTKVLRPGESMKSSNSIDNVYKRKKITRLLADKKLWNDDPFDDFLQDAISKQKALFQKTTVGKAVRANTATGKDTCRVEKTLIDIRRTLSGKELQHTAPGTVKHQNNSPIKQSSALTRQKSLHPFDEGIDLAESKAETVDLEDITGPVCLRRHRSASDLLDVGKVDGMVSGQNSPNAGNPRSNSVYFSPATFDKAAIIAELTASPSPQTPRNNHSLTKDSKNSSYFTDLFAADEPTNKSLSRNLTGRGSTSTYDLLSRSDEQMDAMEYISTKRRNSWSAETAQKSITPLEIIHIKAKPTSFANFSLALHRASAAAKAAIAKEKMMRPRSYSDPIYNLTAVRSRHCTTFTKGVQHMPMMVPVLSCDSGIFCEATDTSAQAPTDLNDYSENTYRPHRRRQSYPSLDNWVWRNQIIAENLL